MSNFSHPPLIYVYTGAPLPNYARDSLAIASKNYDGELILLSDRHSPIAPSAVKQVLLSSFYSPDAFRLFSKLSTLDPLFRSGFWLSAAERFFILNQYAQVSGLQKFFHAELDALVLDLSGIAQACDDSGDGIFIPVENQKRAIASLVYINNPKSLESLTSYMIDNFSLGNEMKILGNFVYENPEIAWALKSDRVFDPSWPFGLKEATGNYGIVDCSGFGQWLLGQDPRNVLGTSWNHHKGAMNYEVERLKFRASPMGNRLMVRSPSGNQKKVAVVHLHAKTFRRIRVPGVLSFYAAISSATIRFPIVISLNGLLNRTRQLVLSRRIFVDIRRAPAFLKSILRVSFEAFGRLDLGIMSERERRIVNRLFDGKLRDRQKNTIRSTITQDDFIEFPAKWKKYISSLDQTSKSLFLTETRIFLTGRRLNGAALIFSNSGKSEGFPGISIPSKRHLLHLSSLKEFEAARHAASFWGFPRVSQWSFATTAQIIDPTIIREMFKNDEEILQWLQLALASKHKRLSAFQSYGNWVFWNKPNSLALAYLDELDPVPLKASGGVK